MKTIEELVSEKGGATLAMAVVCDIAFTILPFVWFGWRVGVLCILGSTAVVSSVSWRCTALARKIDAR